jgi:hypothetical protein
MPATIGTSVWLGWGRDARNQGQAMSTSKNDDNRHLTVLM